MMSDNGTVFVRVDDLETAADEAQCHLDDGNPYPWCILLELGFPRCESCDGTGDVEVAEYWDSQGTPRPGGRYRVEMTVECPVCHGSRYTINNDRGNQ